jgi:hypothetical protein
LFYLEKSVEDKTSTIGMLIFVMTLRGCSPGLVNKLKIEAFGFIEVEKLFADTSLFLCKLTDVWKLCLGCYCITDFG